MESAIPPGFLSSDAFPSILGRPPSPGGQPGCSSSATPASSTLNWKDLIQQQMGKGASSFALSFIPEDSPEVIFSADDLEDGRKDWDLALVGHALGKRPFYGTLQAAVRKQWKLVGTLDLLTLEGDFFLFRFSCREDYDMVWNGGPCFLNGKPFIFRKWTWDFRPIKEDFHEIPLWIKFPNFPLCCWNEKGLSRVASKIGIPLAADHLTTSKKRLTFARVCVQISPSTVLPDFIPIMLNGRRVEQAVNYDWRPRACTKCNTFAHECYACPLSGPRQSLPPRGRSRGRGRLTQRDRSFTRPPPAPSSVALTSNGDPLNPREAPAHPPPPSPPLITSPPPATHQVLHADSNIPLTTSSPTPSSSALHVAPNPQTLQLTLTSNTSSLTNPFFVLQDNQQPSSPILGGQPSESRERRPPSPRIADLNSPPPSSSSSHPPASESPDKNSCAEGNRPPITYAEGSLPSSTIGKTTKINPKSYTQTKGRKKK